MLRLPGGVHRRPARADDVAGSEDRRRKARPPGLVEKPGLDLRLVRAVLAERIERIVFGRGHGRVVAVDPDGSAVKEVLDLSSQGVDQSLGARQIEGDHVDHDIRTERDDACTEAAVGILRSAVGGDLFHRGPGGVGR